MSTASYKEVPKLTKDELEIIERAHTVEKRFLTEQELRKPITAIRNTIKNEELRLRNKYSWLQHQSLLGMSIFMTSLVSMIYCGYLYLTGAVGALLTVVVFALAASFLHELEHDLIHNLYFKSQRWVQDAMFFVIWIVKMTIPPWYRKVIHLRHHVVSGQKEDIEERMIGLGMNLGFSRLALTLDPFYVILVMDDIKRDNPKDFSKFWVTLYALPTVIPFSIMGQLFVHYLRLVNGWTFTEYDPALYLPLALWPIVRDLAVLLVLPNILRQASLVLISTYCHYYGDIPQNNAYYQNQILDHWILWPLQAFCFNFGATHIIHHYIPNQPFYLRQMLAPKVLETMHAVGVRKNDWGIIPRSNTYFGVDHPGVKAKEQ